MREYLREAVLFFALAAAVLGLGMLYGCASMDTQSQDAVIGAVAMDAGYIAYRTVPDARPVLTGVCLLTTITDATSIETTLREALGQVWEDADKMTDTDARMVQLALNTLWSMFEVKLSGESTQRALVVVQVVLTKLCEGVEMAQQIEVK